MLVLDLVRFLDKMGKKFDSKKLTGPKYSLGELGNLELIRYRSEKLRGIVSDNASYCFVIDGMTQREVEINLSNYLVSEGMIKVYRPIPEGKLRALSSRVRENGLEATSQYYQNLQSKSSEVGK